MTTMSTLKDKKVYVISGLRLLLSSRKQCIWLLHDYSLEDASQRKILR